MANDDVCPIWGTTANVSEKDYGNDLHVDSARAGGRYRIFRSAATIASTLGPTEKARLTTWLIDRRNLGVEEPEVTGKIVRESKSRRPLPVYERADRLLRHIQGRVQAVGDTIKILPSSGEDTMLLAWSESVKMSEVAYLLHYLAKAELLDKVSPTTEKYTITPGGYAHLADLDTKAVDSKQAFVAMWFDQSMNDVYENGMEPGIRDAGYEPIRIDRKDHNNKIDDEIIAEIRRSRFLVADFTQGETGARGGVYYEAGFAHGLNIPVIFTCREDVIGKVHFDTRQYNHITWTTPEKLRESLSQRIAATIGDGPLKNVG